MRRKMIEYVRRLLASSPVAIEEEGDKARVTNLLNPIILSLMLVLALAAIAVPLVFPEKTGTLAVILASFMLMLIARFLMKRGHDRLASGLFVAGMWIYVTFLVLFAGGMTSIGTVYYVTLTVIAGLLLGRRAAIFVSGATIIVGLGMVILEATGLLPARIFPVPARSGWLMLSFALILVTTSLNLALRSLDETLIYARKEIAERQQAEKALQESEQRFRTIFDSVNEAIFVHDLATGAILDVNRKMLEMYGYSRDEISRLNVGILSADEPRYNQQEAMNWMQKAAQGEPQLFEWKAKDKHGCLFWVEVNMRRANIDGQDRLLVTVRNIDERKRAEQIRLAIYRISDAAQAAQNLDDFYGLIHTIIGDLMPAKNFYIALYDSANNLFTVPYHVDEFDAPWPPHQPGKSLTAYVLRTGKPLLATPEVYEQLVQSGQVENVGAPSVDWLGVPLQTISGVIGVMAVQTYSTTTRIHEDDKDVLTFVSTQVAMTVERKRAEERQKKMTRQLRAVIEMADELIRCDDLDILFRRAVELAREKLGLERCGLYLLDPSREFLSGTFGTDDQGYLIDEHSARTPISEHPEIFAPANNLWTVISSAHSYWKEGQKRFIGSGWIASTVIRSVNQPIGILYNDTAITHAPFDETLQESVAVYCSLLGNIIERKRAEERERMMTQGLHAIVAATDELIGCNELDTLYRRAVELAREKLGLERCAIFLLDPAHEYFHGTYGTDDHGHTTDEHNSKWPASSRPEIFTPGDQPWLKVEFPLTSSDGEQNHQVGRGWVVYTFIRISNIPIGVFVNDTAITHLPPNEVVQESVALYCSLLGNIIERMRAEDAREVLIAELEAKNAELEQFTYTVSHDLKSPLITIRGFLGFLEKDAQTGNLDRLRIDLTRIDEAAVKMQQLLDQLLELSRIGRLINPPEEILFEIIARDAVELVEGRISAGGVRVHIAANLPLVNGDRARLVEVITNLLDNAVKFMGKQPEPRIEIGTLGPDQDGKVVLYVKDNGIGIDPQYYERIFGLFNKLDPHSEGIGVGLALVKRIIEVHGGRIWIESEGIGHGATFYFTLPGKMVTVPPLCKGGG